ncbi:hypothetical protein PT2222_200045 [Paraburkholderia tropica]
MLSRGPFFHAMRPARNTLVKVCAKHGESAAKACPQGVLGIPPMLESIASFPLKSPMQ